MSQKYVTGRLRLVVKTRKEIFVIQGRYERFPNLKLYFRAIRSPLFARGSAISAVVSQPTKIADTTELKDEIRLANGFLAKMMALEKCEILIMNSLFGSGLPYSVSL